MARIEEGGLRIGCCAHLTMSDDQFDTMPERTRRNLLTRVYFVDTPKYSYCLGARGNLWTLCRRPRGNTDATPITIDEWV